jgi:putative flippase GtrA
MRERLEAVIKSDHPVVLFSRRHIGFVKFLLVGSLNTIIDISLYFLFSSLLHINPIIANILSTGITLCFSFFMNHKFVFKSQRKKRSTAIQFVAVTLFNAWVVQSAVIAGVLYTLGNTPFFLSHIWTLNLLAKLCSVGVSFILNFLGYRYIFKMKENA